MANITEEHLHHMARRHHATMKQLDGIREKITGMAGRFVGTIETGAAAWLGGAIEGKTAGLTVLKIPVNLGLGAILLAASHLELAGKYSEHANHLGNGFIGSYIAATGYAFGKRWKETGKILGGGGHPWTQPYENGWPHEAPAGPPVHGDLSEAQMAAIVQRMQQAAHAPAHP
jgi:hypothetical protein